MHNTTYFKYFLVLAIIFMTEKAVAADFCVSDNQELQVALSTAQSNGQHDHIKLETGDYTVTNGFSFTYLAAAGEFHNLTISGGWSGVNCSFTQRQIYSTTIDGDFQNRGLLIEPGVSSRVVITDLNFINGSVSGNDGGGLYIDTDSNSVAEVVIERNTFVNNYASVGGAFSIDNAYRIDFKNNLASANHSDEGAAVNLESRNHRGVYLINNTIINNTTDATDAFKSSGVYIFVSDSSEAFITNNILWGNQINDIWFLGYEHLYHNNIGSQTAPADVEVANISVTPNFLPYGNAYVPRHNSALHNSGYHLPTFIHVPPWFEEDWDHGDYDVTGTNIRIRESLVDMGAFETPPDYPIFVNGFECDDEARGVFSCN